MRRLLAVSAVPVLMFAAFSVATAQRFSFTTFVSDTEQDKPGFAKPDNGLQAIESKCKVVIVASGIAPRAIAVDPAAHVFLTNALAPNRIFTLTGLADLANEATNPAATARLAAVAGTGSAGSLGDGGSPLLAQFDLKTDSLVTRSGVAIAADGTMLVADTLNSTIRRIGGAESSEPRIIRSIAGRWAATNGVALTEPLGIALDRAGNLYVADHASGTVDFLSDALTSSPVEQSIEVLAHVALPANVALTNDGRKAYIASPELGAVFEADTETRAIRSLAAFPPRKASENGEALSVCMTPNTASAESAAPCPVGIAVDGSGNLFVADANSGSIVRVDSKTSALTAAASGLRSPGAISFDSGGNLYVAEQGANRIIKFIAVGDAATNLTITMPAPLPPPPAPRSCPQPSSIVPVNSFNFCDQPTGGTTPTQAFTLTNNTTAAISGLAVSFVGNNPGDFQASGNTCGTSLASGSRCVINVDFAPTASGSRYATLSVTDSAGDSATAGVTGTGDDFELALNGSPMEQSVVQGGTLKFNFTITPDAVFGGVVTIGCPANLPSLSTCAPSASTVTVTPGTPAQFSLTFETTYNGILGGSPSNGSVPHIVMPDPRHTPGPPAAFVGAAAILASLAVVWFLWIRSRQAPDSRVAEVRALGLMFLLLACGVAFLGGCKHHSVPPNLNTPPGAVNMIVQGTAQNAGRGISIILDVVTPG